MPALDVVLEQLHNLNDHAKGASFERMCAWLLESEPAFDVRRAYTWGQWREHCLMRDGSDVGRDTGIDIVAETASGELWAVQAKCYSETNRVSTDDIDSFIARAATGEFARLLLIASTDHIASVGRAKLRQARNPDAGVLLLENLRELDRDDWPAVGECVRAAVRRPNRMRPHQFDAMVDVVERGFNARRGQSPAGAPDRGQLLMACGTGKTLTGQRISEKLRSERTLVVVPSLSLLEQTHRAWKTDATRRFEAFCFCSDPTVASNSGDESDRDVASVSVPVHTDPEHLAGFLSGGGATSKTRRVVVFATYQSLGRLSDVFAGPNPADPFDLIEADEAHRSAGRVGSSFGLVCDADRLPAKRRLFMTATARVVTGSADSDLVLSMDDESRYGKVFHNLKFSDAVEQNLLCDYQVLVVAAEYGEHLALVEDRKFVSTPAHKKTRADALAVQLAVARAMDRYELRRVLSFHSRVKGAKTFASELVTTVRWLGTPADRLWTQAVSGSMPAGQRRLFLRRLERLDGCDRAVLSNAKCLGEGVDVPAIDAVAFIDPRESVIDIVQSVGRAMRRSPGKDRGTIILPVVLRRDDDPEDALSSSSFATVWKVLRALRAHDDRLDDELHAMLQDQARGGVADGGVSRVICEIPSVALNLSFADAFTVRAVDATADGFDRGLAELVAYVESYADGRPRKDHVTPTGFKLGSWCNSRRQDRKARKLGADKVSAMDATGFVWDPTEDAFIRGLGELAAYVNQKRHAQVPATYKTPTGFNLGGWCNRNRYDRKQGELSAERVNALNAIGFVWDVDQDNFDRGLTELAAYAQQSGRAHVPRGHKLAAFDLGAWCNNRRHDRKTGGLSAEREAALNALGFVWDPDQENFDRGLAEFTTYVERHGNAPVPQKHKTPTGFNLGSWCSTRRLEHKAGKLSAEKAAALDALGFIWDPEKESFDRGLSELAAYVEEHGHARVPQASKTASGFSLGTWCGTRRQNYKAGRLAPEKVASLDALGFSWDQSQDAFTRGVDELRAYVQEHGHARPHPKHKTPAGFNLGTWCSTRRLDYKAGRLSGEQVQALDALGLIWDPLQENFDRGLAEFTTYAERHGHTRVPQSHKTPDGFNLGTWCNTRRQDRKDGRLSPMRMTALDSLGFVWDLDQEDFDRGLAELATYGQEHGHTRVPTNHVTRAGLKLGGWCTSRRRDRKSGELSSERVAALDALGFVWDPRRDDFAHGLAELTAHVAENGEGRVPVKHETQTGFDLGRWCLNVRQRRKKGGLSPEGVAALDSLGFVWDPGQDMFDRGLAELKSYAKQHGNAVVLQKYKTSTGFNLGAWCSTRRQSHKAGKLSAEHVASLDALGFVWDSRNAS